MARTRLMDASLEAWSRLQESRRLLVALRAQDPSLRNQALYRELEEQLEASARELTAALRPAIGEAG